MEFDNSGYPPACPETSASSSYRLSRRPDSSGIGRLPKPSAQRTPSAGGRPRWWRMRWRPPKASAAP